MLEHGLALRHAVVVEHLCRQGDAGDRCLQLMRHVVYEVVLYLCVTLLTEDHDDGEEERYEQHDCERHRRDHEPHRREDVSVHLREVYLHDTHFRLWVVAEENLRIGKLLAFVRIFGTAVDLTTVLCGHGEMVRNVDAVVHQLCLEVLVKQLKVDALFQRLVRCRIENGVDNLVEQRFLVDVTVLHNLLQRFRRLRQRVLVGVQDHGLGHLRWLHRYRLKLKRRIDGAVFAHDRILVRLLNRPVRCL